MNFSRKNSDFIPNIINDLGKLFADDFQVKFNENLNNNKNKYNTWKNDWKNEVTKTTKITTPAVNIKETTNTFEIAVIAPGLRKEDFKLSIENNILNISSDISSETHESNNQKDNEQTTVENTSETEKMSNETNEKFSRTEFFHYKFSRNFELPESIDTEMISAKYDAGILYITLPKKVQTNETKIRKVEIL